MGARARRTSGASDKKVTAARKQQEKAAARRRAKEAKMQKKAEKTFAKSMASFAESSFERARAFVDTQLDDNPGWIRPLADLIRDGALQTLLKSGQSLAEGGGGDTRSQPQKWTGKAKTFGELPDEAKVHMLSKIGVDIDTSGEAVSEEILDSFFAVQFFVGPDAPLPAGARSFDVLEKMAVQRFESLGGHRVAPQVTSQFDQVCFSLEDEKVTNALNGESAPLPSLALEGDEWVLENEGLPSATVSSKANPHLSFGCRTLFEKLRSIEPKAKWVMKKQE